MMLLLSLGTSNTDISYSQMTKEGENKEDFSFLIPDDWKIVSKPENITAENKSSSSFLFDREFPYYEQQNNTVVALKLGGISEMDLDRHSYITISVKDLGLFTSKTPSSNDKTKSESLEDLSQNLIDKLSGGFPPNIITKNSTITLDGQHAFQIIYEPLGCFCQEGNTIVIHNERLYDIFFHAGEFTKEEVVLSLDAITSSFRFL